MGWLSSIMVLAFSSAAYAEVSCKSPTPVKDFNIRRFAGAWYMVAFDAINPVDTEAYKNARCGVMNFNLNKCDKSKGTWDNNLLIGPTERSNLGGPFYLPDKHEGLIKLFYTAANFTFDLTITCTDYETYITGYSCAIVTDTYYSGSVVFFLRDRATYDEVISKHNFDQCYKDITTKKVTEITKRPYYDCFNLN